MLFKLHREGYFKPAFSTKNQCRDVGFKEYKYKITCLFREDLDKQGFLVDHYNIDDAIQQSHIEGSCEEMHLQISDILIDVLEDLGAIGFKILIYPRDKKKNNSRPEAYMEYIKAIKYISDAELVILGTA